MPKIWPSAAIGNFISKYNVSLLKLLRSFQGAQLIKCGLVVQELRGDVEERKKNIAIKKSKTKKCTKMKKCRAIVFTPFASNAVGFSLPSPLRGRREKGE